MSENEGASQGLHYHYHFYGSGTGEPAAGMAPAPGGAYPSYPFGPGAPGQAFGWPGNAPQAGGPAAGNTHPHPGADSLVKGLVIGAGAAYLLTNEAAQRTILRTAVQVWNLLQNGVEELKERLHDAEAEVSAGATTEAPPAPAPEPAPAFAPAASEGSAPVTLTTVTRG